MTDSSSNQSPSVPDTEERQRWWDFDPPTGKEVLVLLPFTAVYVACLGLTMQWLDKDLKFALAWFAGTVVFTQAVIDLISPRLKGLLSASSRILAFIIALFVIYGTNVAQPNAQSQGSKI